MDTAQKPKGTIDNGLLLVTRPALACLLFKADCKGQTVPHPYHDGWRAWLFEITPTVREIAVPFFERAGKKLPACLREGVREAHE